MNSKKIIKGYKSVYYFWDGLYTAVWREMSRLSGEHKEKRYEIENRLHEIKEIIEAEFAPEIGKAIMYEERCS